MSDKKLWRRPTRSPVFRTLAELEEWQAEQDWREWLVAQAEGKTQQEPVDETPRQMTERLAREGYTHVQIAMRVGKSDRTVRRYLNGK